MKKTLSTLVIMLCLAGATQQAWGQNYAGQTNNYISTGIPILLIAPDAVSSAMGDAGVASTPDLNSAHWNNAKFAFIDDKAGVGTTYTPWMRNLGVSDMNFVYLSGYYRINNRSAVAGALTYFKVGDIDHTNEEGITLGTFKPNEFAVDVTYAMKLSDYLSLGATGRFLRSDLTQGIEVQNQTTKAANALAADVGLYYQQPIDQNQLIAAGLHISNLGSKLNYSDDDTYSEFLPANMRLGARYTYEMDQYNKVTAMVDFNKLLVPTPPVQDEETGEWEGRYSSMSEYYSLGSMQGAIYSFFDAPGGLKEELREVSLSVGAEYWYANTFAARAGYFYESSTKGGRQYLTLGAGLRYNAFGLDLAYLLPTTSISNSPLANTVRISITWNMGASK